MSILLAKIEGGIKHLKIEYESSKQILHQGVKGAFNENGLSSIIKDIIPSKYEITKGIIENSDGAQSNETDIIIYDDEILPAYIKNDLSFVPVEAVKYTFEVKTSLSLHELSTTIGKFLNFLKIGGGAPRVLFSYSSDIKGNELKRYREIDSKFLTNPSISVLCVASKCYYYKSVTEHYIKDFFTVGDWLEMWQKSGGMDINKPMESAMGVISSNDLLEIMNRAEFMLAIQAFIQLNDHRRNLDKYSLILNGVNFDEIRFKIHKWVGVEESKQSPSCNIELCLLSGISNTLSKGSFGNYLLNTKDVTFKTYAICFEDMWGNLSAQDFNELGLPYSGNNFSLSYASDKENNKHQLQFKVTG